MPDHFEPRGPRAYAALAVWIAVACGALALDWTRRQLAAPRATWRPLALAALAVALAGGIAHAPMTWGPSHADAATAGEPATMHAAGVEAPGEDVAPTPTIDPLLQPGHYSSPADDATVGPPDDAQAAGPGGPVLPRGEGLFGPLDDGAPPSWLSRPLAPYWGTIAAAAHEAGLDSHWLGIVAMVENPQALEGAVTFDGGHGLAQIQRATAAMIEAESGLPCVDGWADPATSYRCGAFYFRGAVEDGAALARPGDPEPALLMGVAGYNSGHGSAIVGRLRSALASGAADPCAYVGNQYTTRYCYSARDMWAQSLAERGAGPSGPPVGLPHLEARYGR